MQPKPVPNSPVRVQVGVGVAVSCDRQRVLTCLRRAGDYWGGYWEFPGGKCEAGETPADCVIRELQEEVGITVALLAALPTFEHFYADRNRLVQLHPFMCEIRAGEPRAIEVDEIRWCTPAELRELKFLPANGPLIAAIERWMIGQQPPR